MKAIYKYQLEITNFQTVSMRANAKILCAQMQHDVLCLRAECDLDAGMGGRVIDIFGTGHAMDEKERRFIGTVQDGTLVWHVYERI